MKSENASEKAMSQTEAASTSSSHHAKKRPAEQSIKSKCMMKNFFFFFTYSAMQTITFCLLLSLSSSYLASSRKRRKGNGPTGPQEPQPKNAVAILNELKKNLVYELESQEGPYHAPVFTMSVLVGLIF